MKIINNPFYNPIKVMVDAVNLADNELGKFFRNEYSDY